MFKKEQLKEYLPEGRIKKDKKQNRKIQKSKSNGKVVRIFIWICIFLISVSGVLAYLRATRVKNIAESNQQILETMQSSNEHLQISDYESNKILLFTKSFLESYINIPESIEEREQYNERLQNYLAHDLDLINISGFNGYRVLNNSEYFHTKILESHVVVQFIVTYTNIFTEEKERTVKEVVEEDNEEIERERIETYEEKQENQITMLINVPIVSKNGQFAVVENIYFTPIPNLQAVEISAITNQLSQLEVTFEKRETVEQFLVDFFERYATATLDDLVFIMNEPQSLQGMREFVEIVNFNAYHNEQTEEITAKVTVSFQDTDTNFVTEENFTLVLSENNNNFFVEKLQNSLGGDE